MTVLSRSKIFAICLCLILAILISGCSSAMGNSNLVGKWVPTNDDGKNSIMSIEFDSNGNSFMATKGGNWEGTYKVTNSNVRVSLKVGAYYDFTLSNEELVYDKEGTRFTKVKSL